MLLVPHCRAVQNRYNNKGNKRSEWRMTAHGRRSTAAIVASMAPTRA